MFSFKRSTWFVLFGCVWLGVGLYLLILGLNFLIQLSHIPVMLLATREAPLLLWVDGFVGGLETTAICLIACSLLLGHLKGVMVFRRSVLRMEKRVQGEGEHIFIGKVVPWSYLLLIGSMVLLGVCLRVFSVPLDIRGVVDVAVGSALLRGGMFYLRRAFVTPECVT